MGGSQRSPLDVVLIVVVFGIAVIATFTWVNTLPDFGAVYPDPLEQEYFLPRLFRVVTAAAATFFVVMGRWRAAGVLLICNGASFLVPLWIPAVPAALAVAGLGGALVHRASMSPGIREAPPDPGPEKQSVEPATDTAWRMAEGFMIVVALGVGALALTVGLLITILYAGGALFAPDVDLGVRLEALGVFGPTVAAIFGAIWAPQKRWIAAGVAELIAGSMLLLAGSSAWPFAVALIGLGILFVVRGNERPRTALQMPAISSDARDG